MKKLIIPETKNDTISVYEIDHDFSGLIIGYKNDNPVGYYQYDLNSECWWFFTKINCEDINRNAGDEDSSLLNSIKDGLKNNVFDELRVIEFDTM